MGVDARASEEPVEVAVGGPGYRGTAEDAEDDVEDCVGQGAAYGEAPKVKQASMISHPPAPTRPMTEPVITARRGVLKNSSSPPPR